MAPLCDQWRLFRFVMHLRKHQLSRRERGRNETHVAQDISADLADTGSVDAPKRAFPHLHFVATATQPRTGSLATSHYFHQLHGYCKYTCLDMRATRTSCDHRPL